jgi:hypothetical protein
MSKYSHFIITVLLLLSLLVSGCTRDTLNKVQTELLSDDEQILLRVKNDDCVDILVSSFAVFDEGDNVIRQSSDYPGWFPLVLTRDSAVEFRIEADPRDKYRAIINISKNRKSYTLIVDYPAEN